MASTEPERSRHVGAALPAHEIGEPPRQFALVGLRKGAKQHVGDDQPEHMVAEKFEPLVAVAARLRAAFSAEMCVSGGRAARRSVKR